MSKSASDFLKRLEAESRRKQEAFLGGIASRLGRSRITEPPARPFRGAPDFWNAVDLDEEARIRLFMDNWRKAGGHAEKLGSMEEAAAFVRQLIRDLEARQVIRQDQPELEAIAAVLETTEGLDRLTVWNAEHASDAEKEAMLADAAGADIGLVAADCAAAHTGTVVLMSSPRKGRSVSLLPAVLVAVVPASRLKMRLGEVLRPLDGLAAGARPAGIHFVSGPSRSADIENDLTIGVHGPGIVYALVVGDC
ncbi:lactate utilization protein [Paenibacillus sp. GbtcB18]|uniref:LutC/YkgG family protein n=1 Tax=Paenibacillus sp. GbtcB18 TaxID=2824763 RepID=UPI001C2F3C14|nr:lactate utilization protein [Paenibacillus sp. GbtcB18]